MNGRIGVALIALFAVVGAGYWALHRPVVPLPTVQPPPAPLPTPLPERAFETFGRLVNEGTPVAGAQVALFADRTTWLRRLDLLGFGQPDEGRDCQHWPLACHSGTARSAVLRSIDAGAVFPEPLAITKTDVDGRFSLPTATRDAFVVAWKGSLLTIDDSEPSPWRDHELAFDGTPLNPGLTRWTTALWVINPFTKQAKRFTKADWDAIDIPLEGSQLYQDDSAPRAPTEIQLQFDGGPVDGVIELDCGPDESFRLQTDGGVAVVSLKVERGPCGVLASTPTLTANTYIFSRAREPVRLEVRSSLTVHWTPVGALGPTQVEADFPQDPVISIGSLGTRGGGCIPGTGLFTGGIARFDALCLRSLPTKLEVVVKQPGFAVARQQFEAKPGMNELSFTLERAIGTTGFVVDSEHRAVPEIRLDVMQPDGGRTWAESDARGFFAVRVEGREALRFEARHPLLGAAVATSDAVVETMLVLQPTSDVTLTIAGGDGGVLASHVVAIEAERRSFSVRTDARGQVHLVGLRPGVGAVVVEADGAQAPVELDVPATGALRQSVQLR